MFISYAPDDTAWVHALADRLRQADLQVAYDEVVLGPGDVVVHGLEAAIRTTATGLLIFSAAAQASSWVREEYATLMRRTIAGEQRFIPVMLEDVELPEFAANRRYCDFRGVDGHEYQRRVAALVSAIRGERSEHETASPRPVPGSGLRPEGPRRFVLRLGVDQVTFGPDGGVASEHEPSVAGPRLDDLVWRLENTLRNPGRPFQSASGEGGPETLLTECGRELGRLFLSGRAGEALACEVARAEAMNASLRLGLEVDGELSELPWETLAVPGCTTPLALHPRVQMYRRTTAEATPGIAIPGPLRILVAVASPEGAGGGPLLDLEAELAKILDAVESARHRAHVRILNQGTLSAVRTALLQERYHVLHVSCHAEPGVLLMEDEAGGTDRVDSDRFVRQALPPDRGVPLMVLSGCSTARARAGGPAPEESLGSLARGLSAAGVPAVLAMTAAVTDSYATALTGRLYGELSLRASPEVLPAFCDARRLLEEERRHLPSGQKGDSRAEWATPALFLRGPSLPLVGADSGFEQIPALAEAQFPDGVPLRKVGEFVGRRSELRTLSSSLRGDTPGVVLHGIGGIGKSTLAAQLLRRLGDDTGCVVSAIGQTSVDQILDDLARALVRTSDDEEARRVASLLRQPRHSWPNRLRELGPLLGQTRVTLLLDNFEDNLRSAEGGWQVRDQELAEFLASWIRTPGRHRLLVTSRYPFPLPRRADRRLTGHQLGPLSWPEARKLMWRLPALDALSPCDQERAYAGVGGHPRTFEYLDALLRGGRARFADVSERIEALLESRGVGDPRGWLRTAGSDLDSALAASITLSVDDALLHELIGLLSPFALGVLARASVYRLPVDKGALAGPLAEPGMHPPDAEPVHLDDVIDILTDFGLLSRITPAGQPLDAPSVFLVHRWTAGTLARLLEPEVLRAAHQAAAQHWHGRIKARLGSASGETENVADAIEGRFHFHAAGDVDTAAVITRQVCHLLHTWGAWNWEERLLRETLGWLPPDDAEAASFLNDLGILAQDQGRSDQALALYKRALAVLEGSGDRAGTSAVLHQIGRISEGRGDLDDAVAHYEQSLAVAEEFRLPLGIAHAHHQLGRIDLMRGKYDRGRLRIQHALDTFEEENDHEGIADSHHQLGNANLLTGNLESAAQHFRTALRIHAGLYNRFGVARMHMCLGGVASHRGDMDSARTHLRQALSIREDLGDLIGMANCHRDLGVLATLTGDYDGALRYFEQALTVFEEEHYQLGIGRAHSGLADLFTRREQTEQAIDHALVSLGIFLGLEAPPEIREVLSLLKRQRRQVGNEAFHRLLSLHLDDASVTNVIQALGPEDTDGQSS
ncbi:tetratricopeptide repeat protein [Streptomyces sp. NBC_01750]|uniref:tetratricopeptide repeat protein n=1 Tax=Streptomyces sp. NBC_01750 TaxID=2975928 RepID=UPI002DD87908|nr:tetratricopeptide repeat protein [Streptomyces sp. NBC_01750]WSD30610.1 tetratricopeptide repeat protein [Streptomyces sp. NBC_01750]